MLMASADAQPGPSVSWTSRRPDRGAFSRISRVSCGGPRGKGPEPSNVTDGSASNYQGESALKVQIFPSVAERWSQAHVALMATESSRGAGTVTIAAKAA